MAPDDQADSQLSRLRTINFRLSNTPTVRLPHYVPQICQLLIGSKTLLTAGDGSTSKSSSEHAVLVHWFKTRLSSLLQDRSVEGRWAAIVLVKATVEVGGWEMLRDCGAWVRALIAILNKQDPPNSKKLCIIALTRIFMLSKDFPTLTREVTTPSLPPFITACLNHFQAKGTGSTVQQNPAQRALLEPVLESFNQLVPRHPTIFRSFASQIRTILLQVIGQSSREESAPVVRYSCPVTANGMELAQQVFVQLHSCAPRSGSAEEWDASFKAVVATIHETASEVFRAVIESWQSLATTTPPISSKGNIDDEPSRTQPDALGNPGWRGLPAGIERMVHLLGLLRQYVATPTSAPVLLRTGLVADLFTRIFSVTVPKAEETTHWQVMELYNKQVSKQEREELFALLPRIHVAAIEVLLALIRRLGSASIPLCLQFLDQLIWIFDAEQKDLFLRASTYSALIEILKIIGPSIDLSSLNQLEDVIEYCSKDAVLFNSILMGNERQGTTNQRTNGKAKTINLDTVLDATSVQTTASATYDGLQDTARQLLSTTLSKVPADQMSQVVREKLDRAAVLSADSNSMTASVLNPPPFRSSILPIVARMHPNASELEAIMRPRMPVLVAESIDTEKENGKISTGLNSHEAAGTGDMVEVHMLAANSSRAESEMDHSAFLPEAQIRTETTSFLVEKPKIDETAEFSAYTEPGDQMSALEAAIEAQSRLESTKRSPGADGESFSSAKRPRLEENGTMNTVTEDMRQQFAVSAGAAVAPTNAPTPPAVSTALPRSIMTTSSAEVGNENLTGNDSDDDTDGFEVPPLVFKSDDEDDEI